MFLFGPPGGSPPRAWSRAPWPCPSPSCPGASWWPPRSCGFVFQRWNCYHYCYWLVYLNQEAKQTNKHNICCVASQVSPPSQTQKLTIRVRALRSESMSGSMPSCWSFRAITFGWHCLSNATCLMRPHLFYACFVVSNIIIVCCIISSLLKNTCVRQAVLDKWFPHDTWLWPRSLALCTCAILAEAIGVKSNSSNSSSVGIKQLSCISTLNQTHKLISTFICISTLKQETTACCKLSGCLIQRWNAIPIYVANSLNYVANQSNMFCELVCFNVEIKIRNPKSKSSSAVFPNSDFRTARMWA